MTESPLIQVSHLGRSYGGVQALQDVSLDIARGEVHALCGENGAGKSTLIRLLAGIGIPDAGQILVDGVPLSPGRVRQSEDAGIAVMHQESTAFPDLNAVDNLFVGRELTRGGGWLLDHRGMRQRTRDLLEQLGETVDLRVPVGQLPLAQRQMVALARALSRKCRLLIMDEPTASLSARETQALLRIVRQLRGQGVSILYVSHRLEEIFAIADRVTVLRDGCRIETRDIRSVTTDDLIRMMVGREIESPGAFSDRIPATDRRVLEVEHLTRHGRFKDISFHVHAGEIVGLCGLVGAGRSEIARAIFGIDRYDSGVVRVAGRVLPSGSVRQAIAAGVALVPEDRQHEGLILPLSVSANLSLVMLRALTRCGIISRRKEASLVTEQLQNLSVKAPGPKAAAATLSGGNQQKLVLGKWLASRPDVLILDEPTRGVDVGAKAQVHRLIRQLSGRGLATLVISSELPELMSLCDRLTVIREGRLAGELSAPDWTQEQILTLALPDAERPSAGHQVAERPDAEHQGGP